MRNLVKHIVASEDHKGKVTKQDEDGVYVDTGDSKEVKEEYIEFEDVIEIDGKAEKLEPATRAVEMYIGQGSDHGTWGTDYFDIPFNTPDEKIEEVARGVVRAEIAKEKGEMSFCGVYCIPSLDDQPYVGW